MAAAALAAAGAANNRPTGCAAALCTAADGAADAAGTADSGSVSPAGRSAAPTAGSLDSAGASAGFRDGAKPDGGAEFLSAVSDGTRAMTGESAAAAGRAARRGPLPVWVRPVSRCDRGGEDRAEAEEGDAEGSASPAAVESAGPEGSAFASGVEMVMAMPAPRATANAPTRPMWWRAGLTPRVAASATQ